MDVQSVLGKWRFCMYMYSYQKYPLVPISYTWHDVYCAGENKVPIHR